MLILIFLPVLPGEPCALQVLLERAKPIFRISSHREKQKGKRKKKKTQRGNQRNTLPSSHVPVRWLKLSRDSIVHEINRQLPRPTHKLIDDSCINVCLAEYDQLASKQHERVSHKTSFVLDQVQGEASGYIKEDGEQGMVISVAIFGPVNLAHLAWKQDFILIKLSC